jgi:short-subunit dehydrogenase
MNTPENVVLTGLKAFEQNKNYIIPGWQTYLLAQVQRFFPRAWVALIAKRMFTSGK